MDITNIADAYLRSNQLSQEKVGSFKNGNLERGYRFYHVVQQTHNNRNLFSPSVATYYHNTLARQCNENKVITICSVVMPSHTHEIFYTENIESISKARAVACRSATIAVKQEYRERGYSIPSRVLKRFPGYIPIKDRYQLLITLKYIADNDAYLRKDGSKAPYSCFTYWKKDYFKTYCIEILESLFEMNIKEIITILDLDRKDVIRFAERFNSPAYAEKDKLIFRTAATGATEVPEVPGVTAKDGKLRQ